MKERSFEDLLESIHTKQKIIPLKEREFFFFLSSHTPFLRRWTSIKMLFFQAIVITIRSVTVAVLLSVLGTLRNFGQVVNHTSRSL